ncbi:hypothetical protein [Streptomyces sp. NPDC048611]|uniref:hypothetical protein n=1 Tax=Streptomyces sp. NPDC048611 TaxID=3155635 RepID=UPI003447E6C4
MAATRPEGLIMDLSRLRAELAKLDHLPGETPVVLANSAEGHGFSPVTLVENALYVADSPFAGSRYGDEAEEGEVPSNAGPAVFFWPAC